MNEKLIIIGAGGHAKVVLDTAKQNSFDIVGLTDAGRNPRDLCMGYEILGNDDILPELVKDKVSYAAIGIGHVGSPAIRNKVYSLTKEMGYKFPKLIHPTAILSDTAVIGDGTLCSAGAIINAEAQIGEICIINTGAVVEHEVIVENGVHIAPHCTVLGAARIGENSFVGAGSVVLQGVHIGKNCIIGAGSVVLQDVEDNTVVVGTPARVIKRR